jgi:phosphoglycolate phosphatase
LFANFQQRKFVIFDLDGTLIDSSEDIANAQIYAISSVSGIAPDQIDRKKLTSLLGKGLVETFLPFLSHEQQHLIPQMVEAYRSFYADNLTTYTKVFPGMPELLAELKAAGRITAVATTKYFSTTERLVEHFGLKPYLDFVQGTDHDSFPLKPDPYILNLLLQRASLSAADTLMIGDTDNDVICAQRAGVASIGVTWGAWGELALAQLGPDGIAHNVPQLRAMILA